MTIRTLTQLPDAGTITNLESYIEVAVPQNSSDGDPTTPTGYVSKKQKFEHIKNEISSDVKDDIIDTFKLADGSGDIDVSNLKHRVENIESGDITISGIKRFDKAPYVVSPEYTSATEDKNKLVTLGYVRDTMIPGITYDKITPNSKFVAARGEAGFINDGNLLKWSIDADKQESEPVTVNQTGNLVMYGIIADNGDVDARTAWVGLYAEVSGTYVMVSLNPWTIGQKSTIMQYVSFNIPVQRGLKLKVRTGFPVNGTNSLSQGANSAMYGLNVVNSFVGYVIY